MCACKWRWHTNLMKKRNFINGFVLLCRFVAVIASIGSNIIIIVVIVSFFKRRLFIELTNFCLDGSRYKYLHFILICKIINWRNFASCHWNLFADLIREGHMPSRRSELEIWLNYFIDFVHENHVYSKSPFYVRRPICIMHRYMCV